ESPSGARLHPGFWPGAAAGRDRAASGPRDRDARRTDPVRPGARASAVPGRERHDHGGHRPPEDGGGAGTPCSCRGHTYGFHDPGASPGESNSLNGGTTGMDQVTQDPDAHAQGRHGGGAGTGASPWEVGEGLMARTDCWAPAARSIAGGSAPAPETGQDEIEDFYQQSLQDLQEGEGVKGTIVGLKGSEV